MNKILMLVVLGALTGCISPSVKHKCQQTCIDKNMSYEKPVRTGCDCKNKENPEERIYKPDIGYDNEKI